MSCKVSSGNALSMIESVPSTMAKIGTNRSCEEELVSQAVQGDAEAFGALYSLHLDPIYRYLYYRTGNTGAAEDLTEDVFLKAWTTIASYENRGLRFSSWLYRIAHNVAIDYHRTRKKDLPLRSEPVTLAEEEDLGPEELVVRREEVKELQSAISRLPQKQQEVVVLRFIEGLRHAQVAEIIGKSEGACWVIQHRALKALRSLLGEVR